MACNSPKVAAGILALWFETQYIGHQFYRRRSDRHCKAKTHSDRLIISPSAQPHEKGKISPVAIEKFPDRYSRPFPQLLQVIAG